MRHEGSPHVRHLASQSSWLSLATGVITLVSSIAVLLFGGMSPGLKALTVDVTASEVSQLTTESSSTSQQDLIKTAAIEAATTIFARADTNDAEDWSPIAVSRRHDLRLDLVEMTTWRHRPYPTVLNQSL
jgi:hypothetical protein